MIEATKIPEGEFVQLPPLSSMQLSLLSLGFTAVFYTASQGPEAGEVVLTGGLVDMVVRTGGKAAPIMKELQSLSSIFNQLAKDFESRENSNEHD